MSFKDLREAAGYKTQAELARKLEIKNYINISRWESGKRRPSLEMLLALEKALGVSAAKIIEAITSVKNISESQS